MNVNLAECTEGKRCGEGRFWYVQNCEMMEFIEKCGKWRFLRKGYDLIERSELIGGAITDDELWNVTEYNPP